MNFCERYLELTSTVYAGLNLTRILDAEDFRIKQYEDSLLPLKQSTLFREEVEKHQLIVDIGFGGGFPLLPLAAALPGKKFTGFEARGKKSKAVNDIAARMGLAHVETFHYRLEDILFDKPALITFKAVGRIGEFLSYINSEVKELTVVFYKGPELLKDELEMMPSHWEIVAEEKYLLEGTDGRTLLFAKLKNVPRGTNKSFSKKLVKLSELV